MFRIIVLSFYWRLPVTNPLLWKYWWIPVKVGRKAVSFTFHHILESHLWFYYLKELKISPTIYDKWEKCACVQHVGTEILQLICATALQVLRSFKNLGSTWQIEGPVLMYYFEYFSFLRWHLHQCIFWPSSKTV